MVVSKVMKSGPLTLALGAFALMVVIAFWSAAVIVTDNDRARALVEVDDQNRNLALVLSQHAARTLDYADRLALQVSAQYERPGGRFNLERFARGGGINREIVLAIMIVDARGAVRQMDSRLLRPGNLAGREQFKVHAAAASGKPFVSQPLPTSVLGMPGIIVVSRRLNRRDGAFDGIVSVAINPEVFSGFYRELGLGNHGLIALTGLDGFIRARNSAGGEGVAQDVRDGAMFKEFALRDAGVVRYPGAVYGITRREAYRKLDNYPLVISVGVAEESALADVEAHARTVYFGAAFASLLALCAAAALLLMLRRHQRDAAALRDSDARNRRMIENSPDATFINRGDEIVYLNPAALRLLGADSPGQITGKSPLDIVHADDRAAARERIERMTAGNELPGLYEQRFLRLDGGVALTEVSLSFVVDRGVPARQLVARDISERKQFEAALRDSETRYRTLVESSPDALLIYEDDRVAFANAAAVKMFGAGAPEQLIGRTLIELIHPSGHAAALARREFVMKTAQPTGLFEQTFLRLDGSAVEVEGSMIMVPGPGPRRQVVLRDISARKHAQAALHESETRLRIAVESADMTNWEWDIASDQTHWGYGHERLLGPLPEDVLKFPELPRMVHEGDRARFLAARRAAVEHGAPYDLEFRLIRTDGTLRWMRDTGRAVRDAQGGVERMFGVMQDVTRRQDTERELALSRQRGNALMESIPAPAWMKDINGRFIAVNRAWSKRFKVEPGFAIGRTNREVFPQPFADEREREDRQVIQTRLELRVENLRTVDGVQRWFETLKTPIFDETGEVSGIAGMAFETTARRQAEEELRESEQRFRQFAESVDDVIWISAPEPHRMLYVNHAFARIWGIEVEALYAAPLRWLEAVHADDRAAVQEAFERWRCDPAPSVYSAEYRVVGADGGLRWIRDRGTKLLEASGKVFRLQGIAEDITEQRKAELALAESQQRRDALLESNPDPAWLKDCDGHFITANRAWFAHNVIEPHNIAGKTDRDFFGAERAAELHQEDRSVIETRALLRRERNRQVSGRVGWVETVKVPVLDPAGHVVAIVGTSHDISERKRNEEVVRTMNDSLAEKAAELTALNQELEAFAYTVSHDLRAPLRHIDGFISMLKAHAGASFDAQSARYFDRITNAAQRMGQLIDDLLAFSRTGRAELRSQNVGLERLVRDAIENLAPEIGERRIEWSIGALPAVQGDTGLLAIAFHNLLANAVKYTRQRDDARIEVSAAAGGDGVVTIAVRDNGVGFDMKYLHKLFGVFQRLHTDAEFEGTGIGLATVARIAQRHGGRVWAEGVAGAGASFYLTLPRARNEARVA